MDWALMTPVSPERTGATLVQQLQDRLNRLSQGILIELENVGGSANALTATVDPALADGLKGGMPFLIRTLQANGAGGTYLKLYKIDGVTELTGSVEIVDPLGVALTAGRFQTNSFQELAYSAAIGKFVCLTDTRTNNRVLDYQVFATPGAFTWSKPAGTPDNALVFLWGWGAGGAGSNQSQGGAGGGGACFRTTIRAAEIPATVPAVVGAGGSPAATGGSGGNSSFGSFGTGFGGGGGGPNGDNSGGGGGGGGRIGSGSNGTGGPSSSQGGNGGNGGGLGGGGGGPTRGGGVGGTTGAAGTGSADGSPGSGNSGGDAIDGGGGGAGGGSNLARGGSSFWGGAGGGSNGSGSVGGTSVYGGNGGSNGVAGSPRGGGGGRNGAGGRGEIRVLTIA